MQVIHTFQSIVSAEKVLRTDFIPVYTLAATAAAEKLREIIALYAMYTPSVTGSLRVVFVFRFLSVQLVSFICAWASFVISGRSAAPIGLR